MSGSCSSPFQPIPEGYVTTTYKLEYSISGSTVVPKYYTNTTTSYVQTPALKTKKVQYYYTIKTPAGRIKLPLGPPVEKPYIKTGGFYLTVYSFQATPDFDLNATGFMNASITTGTKLENKGPNSLPTLITVANLNMDSFTLNISLRSQGNGLFFKNYGFDLTIPAYPKQEYVFVDNNPNHPYSFPGMVAQIPRTQLQPITLYDLFGTKNLPNLLISLNMSVTPVITGGIVTTTWIYCVKDGVLTLGGTATVTLDIEVPAKFAPNPIGEFTVPPSYFTVYKTQIVKTLNMPAVELKITNTGGNNPGPPPIPTPPIPTPPVPNF